MNWKDEGGFLNKDLNLWKAGCPAYDFYAKTEGSWVLHNHVFIIIIINIIIIIIIIIYQIGNLFSKITQIKELDKYIETEHIIWGGVTDGRRGPI